MHFNKPRKNLIMVKKHINPISVCDGLAIHFAKLGDYNHITIHTGVLGGQELDVFED